MPYGNYPVSGFELVQLQLDEARRAPKMNEQAFLDFYAAYYQTEGDQSPIKQPLCTGLIFCTGHNPSIVWAKLQTLSDGTKIASKQLFG